MSTVLVTPAGSEPVTLAEAKAQCSVSGTDHDTRLNSLISRGREYVENYTGRALITQTWDYFTDEFGTKMELPFAPLQSVTSIKYYDTDGNQQTLATANYDVNTNAQPGFVTPAYNLSWPDTRNMYDAVVIRYVAGYGNTSANVPETIRHAMLMLISHWFEYTEPVIIGTIVADVPIAVSALLDPYRIWRL